MVDFAADGAEYRRIAEYIEHSDLPHKAEKLAGLRTAFRRDIRIELVGEMLLVDGIAVDPSELENGYWL